jgi:hypothetical protein
LDEENPKYVGLAQERGFWLRIVVATAGKRYQQQRCAPVEKKSVINMI